jgi:LytS/YehU family sensor histidine kinase
VSILDEIAYLKNYLRIERIRKNKVEINFPEPEIQNNIKIPPFLFIPFVENAIKHGESVNGKNYINIGLCIDDKIVRFKISNSANTKRIKSNNDLNKGGVGLANVKRRLELLYPDKHKLYINKSIDTYSVELVINLDKDQIL